MSKGLIFAISILISSPLMAKCTDASLPTASLKGNEMATTALLVQPIGFANMSPDGTLVLNLRGETNGFIGHAEFRYKQSDPEYAEILRHIGGIKPGEEKIVMSFPDKEVGSVPGVATAPHVCALGNAMGLSIVRRNFDEGEQLLQNSNFREAIRAFRAGVGILGAGYAPLDAIDDTGYRVVLADIEERKGRLSVAAHLLNAVLSSRLSLCERKLGSRRSPTFAPD